MEGIFRAWNDRRRLSGREEFDVVEEAYAARDEEGEWIRSRSLVVIRFCSLDASMVTISETGW